MAEQGRPTDYKKEYDRQAYKLALLGYVDVDLASFFEVCEATINNWKIRHPSFLESIKKGKEKSDMEVVESLRKRAVGYTTKEITKEITAEGETKSVKVVEKEIIPDTTAQRYWLNNRQSRLWRDKQEIEHSGGLEIKKLEDFD